MSERERAEQDGIERVHRLVAEAVAILSPLIGSGQRGLVMRAALPVEGDAPQVCQWREIATAPKDADLIGGSAGDHRGDRRAGVVSGDVAEDVAGDCVCGVAVDAVE